MNHSLSTDDRLDILDLFARYCRHVDRNEAEAWVALFQPDASFEIVGTMRLDGAEQLAGMPAMLAEQGGGKWRHQITDIVIETDAAGVTRALGSGLLTDWAEGCKLMAFVNYDSALVKVDGTWLFAGLTATMLP